MKSDFVWMDGELVPWDHATVHFLTPTLHYGPGVFEGIRCYNTPDGAAVFRLKDHMIRFLESIHILGISDFPFSLSQLCQGVKDTIKANQLNACYIRPLMFLRGPMGLNMDRSKPSVGIAAWEWGPYLGEEALEIGANMMVSSFTRLHPNINMTKAKVSGNYVNSMLIKTLALRSGYDEAVILDPQGYIAECTGENIFMIRDDVLITPPLDNVLEGITRDSIITIANDLGYTLEEKSISRDLLYIADEAFITGTAAEVVPIRALDTRVIGSGKIGPITRKIQHTFYENVHGKGKFSKLWLDSVED